MSHASLSSSRSFCHITVEVARFIMPVLLFGLFGWGATGLGFGASATVLIPRL
jgi:hypothetical protein